MNTQKTSKKLLAPVVGLAFFLGACGGGSSAPSSPEVPAVKASVEKCVTTKENLTYVSIQDSGKSATLRGNPKYGGGLDSVTMKCVLDGLSIPDSSWAKMNATRALDGMQSDKWGNYAASWTYHPDNGLQVILSTNS